MRALRCAGTGPALPTRSDAGSPGPGRVASLDAQSPGGSAARPAACTGTCARSCVSKKVDCAGESTEKERARPARDDAGIPGQDTRPRGVSTVGYHTGNIICLVHLLMKKTYNCYQAAVELLARTILQSAHRSRLRCGRGQAAHPSPRRAASRHRDYERSLRQSVVSSLVLTFFRAA